MLPVLWGWQLRVLGGVLPLWTTDLSQQNDVELQGQLRSALGEDLFFAPTTLDSSSTNDTTRHLERMLWYLAKHDTDWLSDSLLHSVYVPDDDVRAHPPTYFPLGIHVDSYLDEHIAAPQRALLARAQTWLHWLSQYYNASQDGEEEEGARYHAAAQWRAELILCQEASTASWTWCASTATWYALQPMLPTRNVTRAALATDTDRTRFADLLDGSDRLCDAVITHVERLLERVEKADAELLRRKARIIAALAVDEYAIRLDSRPVQFQPIVNAYAAHLTSRVALGSISAALQGQRQQCHAWGVENMILRHHLHTDSFPATGSRLAERLQSYIDTRLEPFQRDLHAAAITASRTWACQWGFDHLHQPLFPGRPSPPSSRFPLLFSWHPLYSMPASAQSRLLFRLIRLDSAQWRFSHGQHTRPPDFDDDDDVFQHYLERFLREDWLSIFGPHGHGKRCQRLLAKKREMGAIFAHGGSG